MLQCFLKSWECLRAFLSQLCFTGLRLLNPLSLCHIVLGLFGQVLLVVEATRMVSVRSWEKLPPCPTEAMPAAPGWTRHWPGLSPPVTVAVPPG